MHRWFWNQKLKINFFWKCEFPGPPSEYKFSLLKNYITTRFQIWVRLKNIVIISCFLNILTRAHMDTRGNHLVFSNNYFPFKNTLHAAAAECEISLESFINTYTTMSRMYPNNFYVPIFLLLWECINNFGLSFLSNFLFYTYLIINFPFFICFFLILC